MPVHPGVQYRCSFCGKRQDQVHRLIAGPGGVYICNECVDLCTDIIAEESRSDPVHIERAASLLEQTQHRFERDSTLCPLRRNPLEEGDRQLVVATHEVPADDLRHVVWRSHALCFQERSRRLE